MKTAPLHYRLEHYQAKSGKRWRAVVRVPGAQRETTSWRHLQREAKDDGDALLEMLAVPKPSSLTVSEVITLYMASRRLRPTTRQRYQHDADEVAEDDIGARTADDVLPAEWDTYFAGLVHLSPKSIGNRRGLMHAAYRWAKRGGLLTANPVADTDPPKVERSKPPAPTMERVQGAVEVIEGNRLEGAAVLIAADGLRAGEAVARRWHDFAHWIVTGEDGTEHLAGSIDVHDQYTQTRDMTKPKGQSARSAGPSSVPACLADQFPHFDLSVLSEKQLAVVEMRLCGGLSFRKIAAFEGVTCTPVVNRYRRALHALGSTFRA